MPLGRHPPLVHGCRPPPPAPPASRARLRASKPPERKLACGLSRGCRARRRLQRERAGGGGGARGGRRGGCSGGGVVARSSGGALCGSGKWEESVALGAGEARFMHSRGDCGLAGGADRRVVPVPCGRAPAPTRAPPPSTPSPGRVHNPWAKGKGGVSWARRAGAGHQGSGRHPPPAHLLSPCRDAWPRFAGRGAAQALPTPPRRAWTSLAGERCRRSRAMRGRPGARRRIEMAAAWAAPGVGVAVRSASTTCKHTFRADSVRGRRDTRAQVVRKRMPCAAPCRNLVAPPAGRPAARQGLLGLESCLPAHLDGVCALPGLARRSPWPPCCPWRRAQPHTARSRPTPRLGTGWVLGQVVNNGGAARGWCNPRATAASVRACMCVWWRRGGKC